MSMIRMSNAEMNRNLLDPRYYSSVDLRISFVRQGSNHYPVGNLIHHADTWFNLQGNPQVEMQLSTALKEQLLQAANSSFDEDFTPQMGSFDVETLSIPDLVLLYRILNSYQLEYPEPILHVHLSVIQNKLLELSRADVSAKDQVMTAIQDNHELFLKPLKKALLLHIDPVQTGFPRDSSKATSAAHGMPYIMVQIFECLDPKTQGIARQVCKSWYTSLANSSIIRSHFNRIMEIPFFANRGVQLLWNPIDLYDGEELAKPKFVINASTALKIAESLLKKEINGARDSSIKPLLITSSDEIHELARPNRNQELVTFCELLPLTVKQDLPSLQNPNLTIEQRANKLRKELRSSEEIKKLEKLEIIRNIDIQEIPTEINLFINLTELVIRQNPRLAHIPTLTLVNLKLLNVSTNRLTELPDLSALVDLTELHAAFNQLSALPDSMRYLKNLKILTLNGNPLVVLPDFLRFLSNLTIFRIPDTRLTSLPSWIGSLSQLTELTVSSNPLTFLPMSIAILSNLKTLDASYTSLNKLPDMRLMHRLENLLITIPPTVAIRDILLHIPSRLRRLCLTAPQRIFPDQIGSFTRIMPFNPHLMNEFRPWNEYIVSSRVIAAWAAEDLALSVRNGLNTVLNLFGRAP